MLVRPPQTEIFKSLQISGVRFVSNHNEVDMLKNLLSFITLGIMYPVIANAMVPVECPDASQFTHEGAGRPWVLTAEQNSIWKITPLSGPGNDSLLSIMNPDAKLNIHIPTRDDNTGRVSGVICTYTLRDETVLNLQFMITDNLCIADKLGNFHSEDDKHPNNYIIHWALGEEFSFTQAVSCPTTANAPTNCKWNEVIINNPNGPWIHFCDRAPQ